MRRLETARWASTYCFELLPSLLQRQVYAAGPRTVNPCYETAESVLSAGQAGGCACLGRCAVGWRRTAEPGREQAVTRESFPSGVRSLREQRRHQILLPLQPLRERG